MMHNPSREIEAFDLFNNLSSLASLTGTPYRIDEAGVMKCVIKAGSAVGARMQIADKMSVDLSHVNRRPHEPTKDRALVGCSEWDIRREPKVQPGTHRGDRWSG